MLQISKLHRFLGNRVLGLLLLGGLVGLTLFGVELVFAYGLQAFLLALGVANASAVKLPSWIPTGELKTVLIFIFIVTTARGLLRWVQSTMQGAAQEEFKFLQRNRLMSWLFTSESASSAEMTTLFSERTNYAGLAIMHIQAGAVQASSSALIMISLLMISPQTTVMAGGALLLLGGPMYWLSKRIRRAGQGLATEWDHTNERMVMSIKNLLLLRIYGMAQTEQGKASQSMGAYLQHSLTYHRIAGFVIAAPQIFGIALICLIAMASKSGDGLSPGILVSYFYLFIRLLQDLSALSYTVAHLMFHWPQLKASARWWSKNSQDQERLALENQREARRAELVAKPPAPLSIQTPVGWTLQGVGFCYPESKSPLFDGFSLKIEPGQACVITGSSGTGKSTLLGLLLGQIHPTAGRISVQWSDQDSPLEPVLPRVLDSVGYVGPESFLIEGTIHKNLTYGLTREPSKKEIEDALLKAECAFVLDLPEKTEHFLTEQGQGLSAGQKQRLSLARALLRNPKALILDEATANLDSVSEAKLVDTLLQLKRDVTMIVVTHREGMLRLSDHRVHLK